MELYDPRIVPQYPGRMLYAKIPLILEALKTESLGRFMEVRVLSFSFNLTSSYDNLHQIESAADAGVPFPMNDRDVLASQYCSIGELYEDLITGQ